MVGDVTPVAHDFTSPGSTPESVLLAMFNKALEEYGDKHRYAQQGGASTSEAVRNLQDADFKQLPAEQPALEAAPQLPKPAIW